MLAHEAVVRVLLPLLDEVRARGLDLGAPLVVVLHLLEELRLM